MVAALTVSFATTSTACAFTSVNVYRFRNIVNGSYFWTADDAERLTVARTLYSTYSYEGIAWTLDAASPLATCPLYRFYQYSNGCHFYTADPAEANSLMGNGAYHYDGIAYNVSMTAPNPGSLVYRFYYMPNGSHFYSADVAEVNQIIATLGSTFRYEAPVFYVPTAPAAYATDDDRFSAAIMTEYVGNYFFNLDGTWLPNLTSPYSIAFEIRDDIYEHGWFSQYAYGDSSVWELDWKSDTLGGNDYRLADDVDLAVFAGHGLGRNFIMNNAHNDHYAAVSDMKLGDRDLEWLLAFTCRFLEGSTATQADLAATKAQLGTMMNGLHLANGYATKMTVNSGSGARFAAWATAPYGVRVAWYRQAYDTRDNTLDTGDHIIARTFGSVNNVNDYLWGYGNAGRDPAPYSAATAGNYTIWDYDVYGH